MEPSCAPERNASAASLTVVVVGERSVPRFAAAVASARHDFAAARVGNVLRSFLRSRCRVDRRLPRRSAVAASALPETTRPGVAATDALRRPRRLASTHGAHTSLGHAPGRWRGAGALDVRAIISSFAHGCARDTGPVAAQRLRTIWWCARQSCASEMVSLFQCQLAVLGEPPLELGDGACILARTSPRKTKTLRLAGLPRTPGQGLEPQIRAPEARVLPITPSRNAGPRRPQAQG
jgi:hypothetical protein